MNLFAPILFQSITTGNQKRTRRIYHYYDHQRIKVKIKGMNPVDYRVHALKAV
ncbi:MULTISPECIES: IS3 family transposase [Peribacillus]|uniref:IS3 family transposase n=1 Tax=Peribacillus TaxID=2675229 RepID=UPI00351E8121